MKGILIFSGYCGVSVITIMLIARIFFYSLFVKKDPLEAIKIPTVKNWFTDQQEKERDEVIIRSLS